MHSSNQSDDVIADLSQAFVKQVTQSTGLTLDFTPDTLPFMDFYFGQIPPESNDALVTLLSAQGGAYLGEVIRRQYIDVAWESHHQDYDALRLEFPRLLLWIAPMALVRICITHGDVTTAMSYVDMPAQYVETVIDAVDRVQRVREEDFYRISVHFEMIVQAIDLLTALRLRNE